MSTDKNLRLDMEIVHIKDIRFGAKTEVRSGILFINKQEMVEAIADPFFSSIDIDLARPGESVRIIPVKDVVEPRVKLDGKGAGSSFPGFAGAYEGCGEGRLKVFKGCAIVTTGTIVGVQEGVIDMKGTCADYCYYSKLNNIVVVGNCPDGTEPHAHEAACRLLGLHAANYVAEAAMDADADAYETYQLTPVDPARKLPKAGVIYMAMAQGLIHDNYIYGVNAGKTNPVYMNPNEIFDGAIVNGCCVIASDKNTTWDHQNNPLLKELYKHHGVDLEFAGCIVTPTHTVLHDKERNSHAAVRMARSLGWDVAAVVEEGAGNPDADLMMMIRSLEKAGIKTVGMLSACCGEEGTTDSTPEADACINTGTDADYMPVHLEKMDRIIGDATQIRVLSGGSLDGYNADGSVDVNMVAIMCSMNQMGMTRMYSVVL